MRGPKRHGLQGVGLSPTREEGSSAPRDGDPITRFRESQPCGPAGGMALLLTKSESPVEAGPSHWRSVE